MSEGLGFLIRMYAAGCYSLGLAEGQGDNYNAKIYREMTQVCYDLFQSGNLGWATPDIIAAVLVVQIEENCLKAYPALGDIFARKAEQVIRKELADCKKELDHER